MNYIVKSLSQMDAVHFEKPERISYVCFSSKDHTSLGAGVCEIPVGSSNERHTHETSDEVIHIIEGTFRFVFPTGDVVLKEKDCIYIPRGLEHQIFNIGTKPAFHSYTFTDTQSTDLIIKKYNK